MYFLLQIGVVETGSEFGMGDFTQNFYSAVIRSFPHERGEFSEYFLCLRVPGPPEIMRHRLQAFGKRLVTAVTQ